MSFGNAGLATAAERDEQRKMVKYNHLVANLLIFHTAIGMTRALDLSKPPAPLPFELPDRLKPTSPAVPPAAVV